MASAREIRERIERERREGPVRRPERQLEVLWQRQIPAGLHPSDPDQFIDDYAAMMDEAELTIEAFALDGQFDEADLVVTISRRPL